MTAPTLLAAAVVCIALGMVIAFSGILMPGLFIPGTWIILLGLLGCAAAGVLALVPAQHQKAS